MMETLTSRQNRIISHIRRLGTDRSYRRSEGEFVCDGEKLLDEAIRWGAEITCVLWAMEPTADVPCTAQYRVSKELLDYASPLKTAAGVLFTVRIRPWPEQAPGRTLVLETIQDPGNLGTILRTADALGIDSVLLTGECADVCNPKCVRATMGAVFRQPVYEISREALPAFLETNGLRLYGAALSDRAADVRSVDLRNTAVAIGSEGQGLSPELLSMCSGELIIPMRARCESLNAAVAAAIVMWELMK